MRTTPDNRLADPEQLIADLRRQLSECKAERDEALQREAASAEVLQVINSSPGNLAPIFDAILADPKMKPRFVELGIVPEAGTPAQFGKFIADETEKWSKVVKFAGIKPM